MSETWIEERPEIDFLHELGSRIAASDPLHEVLDRVVSFVSKVIRCDSCFIYVLEGNDLLPPRFQEPAPRRGGQAEAPGRTRHHGLGGRAPAAGYGRAQRVARPALSSV